MMKGEISMKTACFIPIKSNSERVKGKNFRMLNGKKLYEYARKGEKIEIPKRDIEIYSTQILNINQKEKEISFEIACSKGTYIRVFCEDFAEKIGTVGFMKDLRRTKVGEFSIQNAVTLEKLNLSNLISVKISSKLWQNRVK